MQLSCSINEASKIVFIFILRNQKIQIYTFFLASALVMHPATCDDGGIYVVKTKNFATTYENYNNALASLMM